VFWFINSTKKFYWLIVGITVAISISYFLVQPKYSFTSDSLIKLFQAYSLKKNQFKSEEYYYFYSEYDPEYKYFPIDYHLYKMRVGEKFIGPFPIAFSTLAAFLLYVLPYKVLPFISLFFILVAVYVARKMWNLTNLGILFLFFCTSVNINYLEFSENSLFISLAFAGITLFLLGTTISQALVAGLLLGLSIFFRLETLLYLPFLAVGFFFFRGISEFKSTRIYYFLFSFCFTVILFFVMNLLLYDTILGPRFIVDRSGFLTSSLKYKFQNFISIVFGSKYQAFYKLGFIGLTPVFIVSYIYGFVYFHKLSRDIKILIVSSVLYLLISPFFAPHDGHWSWGGRYLNLLIFPMTILTDVLFFRNSFHFFSKAWLKVLVSVLIFYSVIQSFIGVGILHLTNRITKEIQNEISTLEKDSILIVNSGILALTFGTEFVERRILKISADDSVNKLFFDISNLYGDKPIFTIFSSALEKNLKHLDVSFADPEFIHSRLLQDFTLDSKFNSQSKLITIKKYQK